jgi:hypothetical protein
MCFLFSGSIFSGVLISQSHHWWTKSHSDLNFQDAQLINQVERPLLISDGSMGRILALSHLLKSEVQLQLKPNCYTCSELPASVFNKDIVKVPDGFDILLFAPSVELKNTIERNYQLQPLNFDLWRIKLAK